VVVEVENPRFRATNAPAPEQAAARESFAYSTLWTGDVAGETADGRVLVDLAPFLTRDAVGIGQALKGAGEKASRFRMISVSPIPTASGPFPTTSNSKRARPSSRASRAPR
jgi:hypothetical protein